MLPCSRRCCLTEAESGSGVCGCAQLFLEKQIRLLAQPCEPTIRGDATANGMPAIAAIGALRKGAGTAARAR